MRVRFVLAALLAGTTFAAAQPGADQPPPADLPPPPPEDASPVEAQAPPAPGLPPINITITNNNNGNNSNTTTQTNDQTNTQTNSQANTLTNTQADTAPVTVTTTAAPGALPPGGTAIARYELMPPQPDRLRWIAVGLLHHGLRASIDLRARRRFTFGVALTLQGHGCDRDRDSVGDVAIGHDPVGVDDSGRAHHERDRGGGGRLVAYVAYTRKLGRFDLRAHVGLGVGGGGHDRDDRGEDVPAGEPASGDTTMETDGGTTARMITAPGDDDHDGRGHGGLRAEAGLLLGLPIGKRLGLIAGPVIAKGGGRGRHGGDGSMLAGLRYRF